MKKIIYPLVLGLFLINFTLDIFAEKNLLSDAELKETSFRELWREHKKHESDGLTKSAQRVMKAIYRKSLAEKNYIQRLKSTMLLLKYHSWLHEEGLASAIAEIQKEYKTASKVENAFLFSIEAEMTNAYYRQNRWRIHQRTDTDKKDADIKTWSLRQLVNRINFLYFESLKNEQLLQSIKVQDYQALLTKERNTENFRPTLFDLLAHQAINYLSTANPYLTQPKDAFIVKSSDFFADSRKFSGVTIKTSDINDVKYKTILLLQRLVKFHLQKNNLSALIDIERRRLQYILRHSVHEEKEKLYFARLIALEKKYQQHKSATLLSHEIALSLKSKGRLYNVFKEKKKKWHKKEAIKYCENAIQRFKESLGAKFCVNLIGQIKAKSISFQTAGVNLPHRPFLSLLRYRNVEKVYFRVARLNESDRKEVQALYGEKKARYFVELDTTLKFEVMLPKDKDYNQHATEVKIPKLSYGHYVLLACSSPKCSLKNSSVNYAMTWVSQLGVAEKSSETNDKEVYIFDRKNGKPRQGVEVALWLQKYGFFSRKPYYDKEDTFTTDKLGIIRLKAGEKYINYRLQVMHDNDEYFPWQQKYQSSLLKLENKTKYRTIYFTDRSIYRPGQTVYFKGITLKAENKKYSLRTKHRVTITFFDVNSQKVASKNFTSNEFGSFAGQFKIPTGLLNGQMRLQSSWGNVYFSVEEYKRPNFETKFKPVKKSFALNDKVTVTGTAQSFSGARVTAAKVAYRVTRNSSYQYWWMYWSHRPATGSKVIAIGEVKSDSKGEYKISFKAEPDQSFLKKHQPIFTYTVHADVTDISGETHSTSTSVRLGYVSLQIYAGIDKMVHQNDDSKNALKYNFNTTNLNGSFQKSNVKVSLYKIKEANRITQTRLWQRPDKELYSKKDFIRWFPSHAIGKGDDVKFRKQSKISSWSFTSKENEKFDFTRIKSLTQGWYKVRFQSYDKDKNEIIVDKYFQLINSTDKSMPYKATTWFYLPKTLLHPQDVATVLWGSSYKPAYALYEIRQGAKLLQRKVIFVENEKSVIKIPVKENYRGNFSISLFSCQNNEISRIQSSIYVPWNNKELKLKFSTFRDKLRPGDKEKWQIKVSGFKKDKVSAEMVATLYDASLDTFRGHYWGMSLNPSYYNRYQWQPTLFNKVESSRSYTSGYNQYSSAPYIRYRKLHLFGLTRRRRYDRYKQLSRRTRSGARDMDDSVAQGELARSEDESPSPLIAVSKKEMKAKRASPAEKNPESQALSASEKDKEAGKQEVQIRKNLQETAFFLPQLKTDKSGNIIFEFTMPEALTRWRFMGMAHSKDLSVGFLHGETVTQKELMVTPHTPRFFREKDTMLFTAKIANLSEKSLKGTAKLQVFDGMTNRTIKIIRATGMTFSTQGKSYPRTRESTRGTTFSTSPNGSSGMTSHTRKAAIEVDFKVKAKQETVVAWQIDIPPHVSAITYRIIAKSKEFSDGQEEVIPVLPNRMLVTESLSLPVRKKGKQNFTFQKLLDSKQSQTLEHFRLTLEFTSNPVWYAVQALPYLIEYPYECAEQVFSRFYANSLAHHLAVSDLRIQAVFERWKNTKALDSNLSKNQELKSVLLQETPWVLNSQNEKQRKKRIGLLFDLARMNRELNSAFRKLKNMQASNGGWPWFKGMPDNRYITRHIVAGLGKLKQLKVDTIMKRHDVKTMFKKAVQYMDDRLTEDYQYLIKHSYDLSKMQISSSQIHHLYARSFYFKEVEVAKRNQKAFQYYRGQAAKYWLKTSPYLQGMIAIALKRYHGHANISGSEREIPIKIIRSLKENAMQHPELGMYWQANVAGYYWYQAPIETQALLIEAFSEVTNDIESVDAMKLWLLKQKQVQDWQTTKATVEAIYALLLRGSNWLKNDKVASVTLGKYVVNPNTDLTIDTEPGTGYFKKSWQTKDVIASMGNVIVDNPNDGVAWGAVYWQYFEDLDKITSAKTSLRLKKKVFLVRNSDKGTVLKTIGKNNQLKVSDLVRVRIELRSDRDMEFLHLKDMRASTLEPVTVISQYKYQDGLGYYETTKDASTNFFIHWLPKGSYIFEYSLRVTHKGDFSNGITTIQSMYAPEFSAHSKGVRLKVF